MSYVLQLLHAPGVLGAQEAMDLADRLADVPADDAARARFARFAARIQRSYPDLCAQDLDGRDPRNAWVEPLRADNVHHAVWGLAPKTEALDENFIGHVALAAAAADLHVLDPQCGVVYRPDRKLADDDGRIEALATPAPRVMPPAPPPAAAAGQRLQEQPLLAHLNQRLAARLAPTGFVWTAAPKSQGCAERRRGAVRQRLVLQATWYDDAFSMSMRLQVFCEGISSLWQQALGDAGAAYAAWLARQDRPRADFTFYGSEILQPPGDPAAPWGPYQSRPVKDLAQAEAWLDGLCDWWEREGLRALDALDGPQALAHIFLTAPKRSEMLRRNDMPPCGLFSVLVLAAGAGAELDAWLKAAQDHWRRSGVDRWLDDGGVLPAKGATLAQLVSALQGPELAPPLRALFGKA